MNKINGCDLCGKSKIVLPLIRIDFSHSIEEVLAESVCQIRVLE